ncbi:MAG: glycosyltransferase family 4 protein [Alphaproteobacteria bacterium]|nr:glycosyltransferase family 4 protein [Alphaproteobacteria bacterium]
MAKQTLIFDASVIASNLNNGRGRSGIYFATYNILKNLVASGEIDVSLYSDYFSDKFNEFVRQNFGDVPIYYGNRYVKFLSRMVQLDKKLREKRHNVLKLLLNIFVRKPAKFIGSWGRLPYFDAAFSPIYVFPKKIRAKEKYIILYDAIPILFPLYYETHRSKAHFWFEVLTKYIKTKPKCRYFAISESCRDDFIRLLDMKEDDITVMPLAAGDNFYQEKDEDKIRATRAKYNIPADKKYVFSLCTLEPRKNLIRAVKTFIEFIKKNKIDDMVFVLGGAHWDDFIGKLESEIDDLGKYKTRIIRAGYIDDADLTALYSGATFFVYTSQYEGFGLPPLEAMQCGCPVITSNTSSLPEVVGDAAIMIDWDDDAAHIAAYERYYNDKELRNEMRKRGLARAKQFTWENTADIIVEKIKADK